MIRITYKLTELYDYRTYQIKPDIGTWLEDHDGCKIHFEIESNEYSPPIIEFPTESLAVLFKLECL